MGATRDVRIQHFGEMEVFAVRHGQTGQETIQSPRCFSYHFGNLCRMGHCFFMFFLFLQNDVDRIDVEDFV